MGKWDFDGDEILFFVAAGVIGIVGILYWYWTLIRVAFLGRSLRIRMLFALAPIPPLLALWFVLTHWADPKEVVGNLDYQLLFLAGGLAWLTLAIAIAPYLGVSARSDAIERSNSAAASVVCGAMLGVMLIYCGGNVGSGPTIWTTIVPAFVASLSWLALWFILEMLSHPSEAIAIDRDLAGGIRQAGFLIACGLILGRAIAGDWMSWQSTFEDMLHLSWPVLPLLVAAIVMNWLLHPTAERPAPSAFSVGRIPAVVFVLIAISYLILLGPADIGKHVITYEQYMKQQ